MNEIIYSGEEVGAPGVCPVYVTWQEDIKQVTMMQFPRNFVIKIQLKSYEWPTHYGFNPHYNNSVAEWGKEQVLQLRDYLNECLEHLG